MNSQTKTRFAVISSIPLLLNACSSGPMTKFSGAASLRVEVEVYKGPLTQSDSIQLAELKGIANEAKRSLSIFRDSVKKNQHPHIENVIHGDLNRLISLMAALQQLPINNKKQLKDLENKLKNISATLTPISYDVAVSSAEADFERYQTSTIAKLSIDNKTPLYPRKVGSEHTYWFHVKKYTEFAAQISAEMRAASVYWTKKLIPELFGKDIKYRRVIVDHINIIAEYSKQIGSRAESLNKQITAQIRGETLEGWQLSLGDHLRDSQQTGFTQLYDWYDAVEDTPWYAFPYDEHPAHYPDSPSYVFNRNYLLPKHRIKASNRLHNSLYWAKTNEVHTSGQGDFSTALIKDDLGNWNLKSFDNQPGELLNAQHEFAMAGIKAATELISSSTLEKATKFMSNFSSNRLGAGQQVANVTSNVSKYKAETEARLAAIVANSDLKEAHNDVSSKKAIMDSTSAKLASSEKARDDAIKSNTQKSRKIQAKQTNVDTNEIEITRLKTSKIELQSTIAALQTTTDPELVKHRDKLAENITKAQDSIAELEEKNTDLKKEIVTLKAGKLDEDTLLQAVNSNKAELNEASHQHELAKKELETASRIAKNQFQSELRAYRTLIDSLAPQADTKQTENTSKQPVADIINDG